MILLCNTCGALCVRGRSLSVQERKATGWTSPLASDYVMVCPVCYPEKVKK